MMIINLDGILQKNKLKYKIIIFKLIKRKIMSFVNDQTIIDNMLINDENINFKYNVIYDNNEKLLACGYKDFDLCIIIERRIDEDILHTLPQSINSKEILHLLPIISYNTREWNKNQSMSSMLSTCMKKIQQ